MKHALLTFMFTLAISCAPKKSLETTCNENFKFKTEFFKNVKIVDDWFNVQMTTEFKSIDEFKLVITPERAENFEYALRFISHYAHVSYDSMSNYDRSYPYGVYEKDKEGWLKWYEENKCNNIQFKTDYIIPVYKGKMAE